jgi:hypothetical protein
LRTATREKRSIITGRNSPLAAGRKWNADGSRTKYGLFWQVILAKFFAEWLKDTAGLQRVTHEVWQMTKLDLPKLEKAFAGR